MHGFEAEGAAAIVKGQVIEQPETVATAIRIGQSCELGISRTGTG